MRAERLEAHLDTLLNRDIRQVYPTTPLYNSLRGPVRSRVLNSADDIVRGLYAAEVPLVFDSRHGRLGLIATTQEEPAPRTLGSAPGHSLNGFRVRAVYMSI